MAGATERRTVRTRGWRPDCRRAPGLQTSAGGSRHRSRRIVAPAVAALLAVAACSGSSEPAAEDRTRPGAASSASVAGTGAFPVTIEHAFGATTIDERPERIVTVGLTDQDPLLALGVVPVGVTEWFGEQPSGAWAWARDELGGGTAEVVGTAGEIGFERIAAMQPDLILAVYAGLTDGDYGRLSQIAPTVAQPSGYVDYGVPWDEQTVIVGRAVGLEPEARALVDDVEGQVEAAKLAHPEFDGATGVVATPYAGGISIYAPQDSRGRFLSSLGFVQPPEIEQLARDAFSADLSYERVDLVDVDAIVWIVNDLETDVSNFDTEPLYANLRVHREHREVFVENLDDLGAATSFVTVLSVPYLLDNLVPLLADAVDGRVPS